MKATITLLEPKTTITDADVMQGGGQDGPMQFALTVQEPIGGTIETNPESGTYDENTVVTLKAIPNSGFRFINFFEAFEKTKSLTWLKLTKASQIIATFIQQFTLTTSVDGDGTITPASGTYDEGDVVTITATPTDPETTEIDRIEKTDDLGTVEIENNSTLEILKNNSIAAYFKLKTFLLTISNSGNCTTTPITGDHEIVQNTSQEIEVIPDAGYLFKNVTIAETEIYENPYSLLMDDDKTAIANVIDKTLVLFPDEIWDGDIIWDGTLIFN